MECTCKSAQGMCQKCGHYRSDCHEPCQRGMHDACYRRFDTGLQYERDRADILYGNPYADWWRAALGKVKQWRRT